MPVEARRQATDASVQDGCASCRSCTAAQSGLLPAKLHQSARSTCLSAAAAPHLVTQQRLLQRHVRHIAVAAGGIGAAARGQHKAQQAAGAKPLLRVGQS